MEQINYQDVHAKKILLEIKARVRQNGIQISGEKEKEVDIKLVEVIKDLCSKNMYPVNYQEENERIICTLILYYTALYNDNIQLLNELLDNEYNFGEKRAALNLFALDKRISKQFDSALYIQLLKTQNIVFEKFFHSLKINDKDITISDEILIDRFCSILNKNPQIAIRTIPSDLGNILPNLLTKHSLTYFGEEIILSANEKQKINIISESHRIVLLNEDEKKRMIRLAKEHQFSTFLYGGWKNALRKFTDEELLKIDQYDENLLYKYYVNNDVDVEKIRKVINSQQAPKTMKKILQ